MEGSQCLTVQVAFYEQLCAHPHLVAHCPSYLGTRVLPGSSSKGEMSEHHRAGCGVMICLEDLTSRYSKPCVCDVKVGNIQHGHDAPPHKAARSQKKCRRTTSLKLGFRLCGMKVWQPQIEEYVSRDKYDGRRVRAEHIDTAVGAFFDDGVTLRHDAIAMVEEKVATMLATMRDHQAHRFYSASVLLIYEGDPTAPPRCDVRLIDFAHTALVSEIPSMQGRKGPDTGLLLGLLRLDETLLRLQETGAVGTTTSDNETETTTTDYETTTTDNVGCDEGSTTDCPTESGEYEDWAEEDHTGLPAGECTLALHSLWEEQGEQGASIGSWRDRALSSRETIESCGHVSVSNEASWQSRDLKTPSSYREVAEGKKLRKKKKKPTKVRPSRKESVRVHLGTRSGESESWSDTSLSGAEEEESGHELRSGPPSPLLDYVISDLRLG